MTHCLNCGIVPKNLLTCSRCKVWIFASCILNVFSFLASHLLFPRLPKKYVCQSFLSFTPLPTVHWKSGHRGQCSLLSDPTKIQFISTKVFAYTEPSISLFPADVRFLTRYSLIRSALKRWLRTRSRWARAAGCPMPITTASSTPCCSACVIHSHSPIICSTRPTPISVCNG